MSILHKNIEQDSLLLLAKDGIVTLDSSPNFDWTLTYEKEVKWSNFWILYQDYF